MPGGELTGGNVYKSKQEARVRHEGTLKHSQLAVQCIHSGLPDMKAQTQTGNLRMGLAFTCRSVGSRVVERSVGLVDGAGDGLEEVSSFVRLKEGEPVSLLSGEKVGGELDRFGSAGHDASSVQLLESMLQAQRKIWLQSVQRCGGVRAAAGS